MKTPDDIAVQLLGVSKKYVIHHEKPTLVEKFIQRKYETFWALNEMDLTIRKGEKLGIIGPNGSGKTTLLKIIAGITSPTTGTVKRKGKVVSLIDLEAGFHPELSGIQNIYLNGMLLGMSKRTIDQKLRAIIEFADIGQFIDVPLYTYSEGMMLRLGFSVAIQSNPDILILDEGLGVGDTQFRKKSQQVLKQMIRNNKTFIIASHWIEFVYENCETIIELRHGRYRVVKSVRKK